VNPVDRTTFRQRIRAAIANPALQVALDANAQRRGAGRAAAFQSLPDWGERRRRAHQVRADTVEHLDEYLEAFIKRAQGNGIVVHRAQTAVEATRLVIDLSLEQAPAPLVAKSKSMVSEEIGLNDALEARGIRAVETDLGEYIVQLRGERPSHIITPAVHLRRHEVGALFHEKLGIAYTEDVAVLTAAARATLREVFLAADIGVSGVNFGIAETGAICIVSNEGNARMVTTLPRLHIALMGMERLVPGSDDLALMLSLLPRSATGQKLSVYTQILGRPAAHQERHIIILDGGRSELSRSALAEALYCIRCGACLNACPVFREIGGHAYRSAYPGPIGSVLSATLFGSDFEPLAQASTLCGACKEACPVDIDLPRLLVRVRAGRSPQGTAIGATPRSSHRPGAGGRSLGAGSRAALRFYGWMAARPRVFAFAQRAASYGSRLLASADGWIHMPSWTGWGTSRDLPRFAATPLRESIGRRTTSYGPPSRVSADGSFGASAGQSTLRTEGLLDQFAKEFKAVGGSLLETAGMDLRETALQFIRSRGSTRVYVQPHAIGEMSMEGTTFELSDQCDPSVTLGITLCACGVADTGSIVIATGEDPAIRASLLPEIHLAILREDSIVPTLEEALALPAITGAASVIVITGPSRTADIEMTHTIGVHGPRELFVLVRRKDESQIA